jgi:hypothetical protein
MRLQQVFIKSIIIIAVLLAVIFLSQQPYSRELGKSFCGKAKALVAPALEKMYKTSSNYVTSRFAPQVEKGKVEIQQKVIEEKNNLNKSIWENIKNYFAETFSKISGTKVE